MKFPQKWIDALIEPEQKGEFGTSATLAERQLFSLYKVGALKDPPKPREWWICTQCHRAFLSVVGSIHKHDSTLMDFVHVREVIEE